MLMKLFLRITCFALLIQGGLWGQAIFVTSLLDFGGGSLRSALTSAQEGDQVVFDPPLLGTIVLLSPLPSISADITIIGPPTVGVTVSGNSLFPVFTIENDLSVTIKDLNISLGVAFGSGPGLFVGNDCKVTVSNGSFSNCTSTGSQGGAIHLGADSVLTLNEAPFNGNSSEGGGDDIFLSAEGNLIYWNFNPWRSKHLLWRDDSQCWNPSTLG